MSKNYTYKSAGYDLTFPGPASVEEYDQKAGVSGQCLEDAIDNEVYRGTLPTFWSKALPKVAELTGIPVGVDEKATEKAKARAKDGATVKDVPEKFGVYMGRVEAQLHDRPEDLKAVEDLLKEVALSVEIDPSPTSRAKGPGKEYLAKADSILALPDEAIEEKVAKIEAVTGTAVDRDENGKPNRDSLALGVKAWFAAQL